MGTPHAPTLAVRVGERGVLIATMLARLARLVTHLDVDDDGIDRAIEVLGALPA
jgi:threonine aldolase